MELGYNKNFSYTYGYNTIQTRKENWEKIRKKIRESGYTEVRTFTTITHTKENINKLGHAK